MGRQLRMGLPALTALGIAAEVDLYSIIILRCPSCLSLDLMNLSKFQTNPLWIRLQVRGVFTVGRIALVEHGFTQN
jgi:hypothetical protein